ncbi:tissue factor pathway inhibitor a [Austrofundulus limnaeus]|uniref:Tissue factor pathway inhibitor n=1 Tax=Austrofundulus limnaeus TaxID=52670 RepID=A0A2I4CX12_AUSLI|nr:PREDICTED: tissue factor pathway inhibitor-like [Austrofundulus limnaeus]
MAPSNCWILCAVSLACLLCCGSCRRGKGVRSQEPLIFNELCAMRDEPGPCKAIKDRFFFNVNTGLCELFEYGGCGGNANNFQTKEECEESCVVSDEKSPCHLPEAPGPCRGLVARYFFDSSTQQCKSFFYGGCFGNANNFRSMSECQARCLNPANPTEAAEDDAKAARIVGLVQPTVKTESLVVSGPAVQQNDSQPVMNEICLKAVQRGPCPGSDRRFAFNPESRRCQPFSYSGCGGNENNFRSRRLCYYQCIRTSKGHEKMIKIKKKNVKKILNRSVRTHM